MSGTTGLFEDLSAAPASTGLFSDLPPGAAAPPPPPPGTPDPTQPYPSFVPDPVGVAGAAVQGFAQGFGSEPFGMTPEDAQGLRTLGVIPDPATGQGGPFRALNEAAIRPLWAAGDVVARGATGLFTGVQAGVHALLEPVSPQLARDVAAVPEAFGGSPHDMAAPHVEEPPAAEPRSVPAIFKPPTSTGLFDDVQAPAPDTAVPLRTFPTGQPEANPPGQPVVPGPESRPESPGVEQTITPPGTTQEPPTAPGAPEPAPPAPPAAPGIAPAPPVEAPATTPGETPATPSPPPNTAGGVETSPAAGSSPKGVDTGLAPSPIPPPTSPTPDIHAGTVSTATGRKINVKYEVVPADTLTAASGDLQPRERDARLSSDAQIASIASNLDPSRLMRSPEADRGAPVVGPDHIIESGNGRVQAITRAAELHPEKYAAYVQALRDAGHDVPAEADATAHVLVARRQTELSDEERRAFVREANQSATQRMSAGEQARADAANLSANLLNQYDHDHDVTHGANREFVRSWIGTLPEAERNSVVDAQGQLSAEGVRRLNGAMLARAYDDKGTLARGLESTDDVVKAVSGGMSDAAPAWAKLRAGIEAGHVPAEFDTSRQLIDAADRVRQAREKRQTMNDILNQQDAFNPLDPITAQYVRALYNHAGTRAASRPAVADFLRRYAEEGQRQQGGPGLFGEGDRVKPGDTLDALLRRREPETTGANQGNMFAGAKKATLGDTPASEAADRYGAEAKAHNGGSMNAAVKAGKKPADWSALWFLDGDKPVFEGHPNSPEKLHRGDELNKYRSLPIKDPEGHASRVWFKPDAEANARAVQDAISNRPTGQPTEANRAAHEEYHRKFGLALGYDPAEVERFAKGQVNREANPAGHAGEALTDAQAELPLESQGQGPTRPPMGGVRPGREFNADTSPYREVFRDAGHDPDLMVSRPIADQVKVIADQIQTKFGFKAVDIDPKQNLKELRDQLSNFYQNAREMTEALGMPYEAIGLNGRVTFETKPYYQKNQALGHYMPSTRAINIPGRSNSFAHEWTHALDHYLSDVLANNPKAMKLLSMKTGMWDDPANLNGKPLLPGSPGEAFSNLLRAMYGKDAANAAEALRLQMDLRGNDKRAAAAAQVRLTAIESEFAKNAKAQPGGMKYWATPHEMLARAHEAYVQDAITRQGGDTRAIAKPYYDAAFPGDNFARLYPQAAERDAIFQAFTDLHDTMRAQTLLGQGVGARPGGLDIVDPSVWDRMVNRQQAGGAFAFFKREVQAQRNFLAQIKARAGFSAKGADPGHLKLSVRAADAGRALFGSVRSIGEALAHRQPTPEARRAFTAVLDKFSPAEGIRDPAKAIGRHIGQTFEEQVRAQGRSNVNRLANILDQHDLAWDNLTSTQSYLRATGPDVEKAMLRHVLSEGTDTYTDDRGTAHPIPENIRKAGGAIRYLLDREWDFNTAAGVDVGYARSGYFPRMYDDTKIFGDRAGFQRDAGKLHELLFDKDVGDDPDKFLKAWGRLSPADRGADPQLAGDMDALKRNLRAQDKLRKELDTSPDPAAVQGRIDLLEQEARDIHDALHDQVRGVYAQAAAREWWHRINIGDPVDFDTRGPSAAYTRARVLPPEADRIMRNWMVNDPTIALPRYFQQSARKIAFNERFGAGGSELEDLLRQASEGGARGEDIRDMRHLVEVVTGRAQSGLPSKAERALNTIHALGTIALMPRAAWSSLSEPMAALARTGKIRVAAKAFAYQLGDIVKTADSKERAAMANALGITISHLHDAIINDRTDAHYRDAPGLSKLMANYYRRTGLTQLTNSQRRSTMAAGHIALDAWARDVLGTDARRSRDAAAQLRDLGVPDAQHRSLAKWVTAHPGLPSLADLETPGGRLWGQAVSRLTDQIIQDPMRVDKPLMSQNPVGRLMYGLMSFNYAFAHNIVDRTLNVHQARVAEGYKDLRAAGSGKIGALRGTAAPLARAGAHITTAGAAIWAGSFLSTAVREALFNGDTWAQHEKDDDLGEWLADLSFQRTGVNGPFDPLVQAMTGLKYQRDLSSLTAGAQVGYFLQAAANMLKPLTGAGSPHTNTSDYNAIQGAYNLFAVPAAGMALTVLPGGPLASAAYGATMQGVTGRGAGDAVASALVGPKGTGEGGEPPTPKAPAEEGSQPQDGGGALGGVPLGAVDDIAGPALRLARPLWRRLPLAGKAGAIGAGALYTGSKLANEFGRWSSE